MKWRNAKQNELSFEEEIRIAELKNQHWPYGIDSQIQWMKKNIYANDVHLMGEEETEKGIVLRAYLTLSQLNVVIDNNNYDLIGIGGVCVDKGSQHTGMGKRLVDKANIYIKEQGRPGLLLCKDNLADFYKKCGWNLLKFQMAVVAGRNYEHNIMLLGANGSCSKIIIDRNF